MFYSQTLTKQQIDNLCVRCDVRFERWSEYHVHTLAKTCQAKIKPMNTSGRSKTQIVHDWESNQKEGAIIQ